MFHMFILIKIKGKNLNLASIQVLKSHTWLVPLDSASRRHFHYCGKHIPNTVLLDSSDIHRQKFQHPNYSSQIVCSLKVLKLLWPFAWTHWSSQNVRACWDWRRPGKGCLWRNAPYEIHHYQVWNTCCSSTVRQVGPGMFLVHVITKTSCAKKGTWCLLVSSKPLALAAKGTAGCRVQSWWTEQGAGLREFQLWGMHLDLSCLEGEGGKYLSERPHSPFRTSWRAAFAAERREKEFSPFPSPGRRGALG